MRPCPLAAASPFREQESDHGYRFGALRRWALMVALLFAGLAPLATVSAQSAATPFTIGVLPNLSARVILANYQPMRDCRQRELKRPVENYTAGDFPQLQPADTTWRVCCGRHSRQPRACGSAGCQLGAGGDLRTQGAGRDLVSLASNPDSSMTQLRGKALAVANPPSAVAVAGLQWLGAPGLQAGVDFKPCGHAQ